MNITVVGFVMSPNINDIKCNRVKEFVDIRKIGYTDNKNIKKSENGYSNSLKLIKNIINKPNKSRPPIYWIFDLNKDKVVIDKYDVEDKNNVNEQTKIIVSNFYNDIMTVLNDIIINYVDNHKDLTLQNFYKLIDNIDKKYLSFSKYEMFDDLLKNIYYDKIAKTKIKYDKKEDNFPGLDKDSIKLPAFKKSKKDVIETIILKKYKESDKIVDEEVDDVIKYNAICQHNITWDNIMAIRKKNPNKFSEIIYEFFQQYVEQNHEGIYICKSCKTELNIQNYVLDGTYDDDAKFVPLGTPMSVPIEEIREYEKYKPTIKNIEKNIERIASITNINTLIGTSTKIKSRISKIVKDIIDLLLIHNTNMKDVYKSRTEKIAKYGLNKDISNFFNFELDNSIFVYSSKDKDYFKQIKRNNIWVYLIFIIIMELSDTQLLYLKSNKLCNYYNFSKYGINLFKNIYILKNNSRVAVPILNYELLCYVIYYMSCMITRYNLWQTQETPEKKEHFDINTQRKIIQTLIDLINSVIEVYTRKKRHYIYDIIVNRFFTKLNTTYSNSSVLEKIKDLQNKSIVVEDKKIKMVTVKTKSRLLEDQYSEPTYFDNIKWRSCLVAKSRIKEPQYKFEEYDYISNVTNCESGEFHKWIFKDNTLICKLCNIKISDVDTSAKMTEKILANYLKLKDYKLIKNY